MANWQTPKTDWITNPKPPEKQDFNRIEENTLYLLEQIEAKKGIIVEAINDKSIEANIENTYTELGNKIRKIIDTVEIPVNIIIPGYQEDTWSQILYIDKPDTSAHLYMLIDLLDQDFFRSISICDLNTCLWNNFVYDFNDDRLYGRYYVKYSYTYLRLVSGLFPLHLGSIRLEVEDVGTQLELRFSGRNHRSYPGRSFLIPIKIFGKIDS